MNDVRGTRNVESVRAFFPVRSVALAAALVAVGGCAATGTGHAFGGPGSATIVVENHVATEAHVDGIWISIDGNPTSTTAIPPCGERAVAARAVGLRPGPHVLSVRFQVRSPSSETMVLASERRLHLNEAPALVTVDVRGGEATESPVAIGIQAQGGELEADVDAAPQSALERCKPLRPVPKALCRAAIDLDLATRNHDVVATLCVRDRLNEMRRLSIVSESPSADTAARAQGAIAALSRQVDQCGALRALLSGPEGLTAIPPQPGAP